MSLRSLKIAAAETSTAQVSCKAQALIPFSLPNRPSAKPEKTPESRLRARVYHLDELYQNHTAGRNAMKSGAPGTH